MKKDPLWKGTKTARIEIRCTPDEKKDLEKTCMEKGGISLAQHLMTLHHKDKGRLK